MKKTLLVLALAVAAAATSSGAGANGSAYSPGLVYGWPGVGVDFSGTRFVAFSMPKSTIVAAVRARDGRVLRTKVLRGFYGVPLVAYDGTSGGLAGSKRSFVLSSYGPVPGSTGKTRFLVLSTRTLTGGPPIVLRGSWSFDAISPDAATLYLTQHLRAGDDPLYRVRPFDRRAGRLGGAIVDRLEGERDMGGVPVSRMSSADGRWAYTLYARRNHEPFVHALDTAKREAFCIDLPLDLAYDRQWALRLKLAARTNVLSVWLEGGTKVASVNTSSWKVAKPQS
jgi:hypothetical protein